MGSTLAKTATALVLLGWHRGSPARIAVCAAVAWIAVHAYTGAVYVAVGVFAAILLEPLARKDWKAVRTSTAVIALVIAALQVPYVIHQFSTGFRDPAMGAVTGGLARVAAGAEPPQVAKSVQGYVAAVRFLQGLPSDLPAAGWLLAVCSAIMAFRFRRDPAILAIVLLPQALAIVGYAMFLGALDHYYYLSLMPAAVLTVLLSITALPWPRIVSVAAVALLCGALAAVPARLRFAATMHKMPEYGPLVEGSRKIVRLKQPMRTIETEFSLPPTVDRLFVYRILGGQIDGGSPWIARITWQGDVIYRKVEP
jgi:hypothetical protein